MPARALAVLYSNYLHLVTTADTGIKTVADLKGRMVSTGAPGSGTEVVAFRVLEALGLDPKARPDDAGARRQRSPWMR